MPATLKFYDYERSSAAFRVRIALKLKGLEYETQPVSLKLEESEQHSDWYQAVNPSRLVPALDTGHEVISQSLAIIHYLEDQYPSPSIYGDGAFSQYQIEAFALNIACDIHPLNNLRVLTYLTKDLGHAEEEKITWYHHWLEKGFSGLEVLLQRTKGRYCFGDQFTLADIILMPQLINALRFNFSLSSFPNLQAVLKEYQQHPAILAAMPKELESLLPK